MTHRLVRQSIAVRDQTRKTGRRIIEGYVSHGLAIVPHQLVDEYATETAITRWIDAGCPGPQPRPIIMRGHILVHAPTGGNNGGGYVLTPPDWLLPTLESATACVRHLVTQLRDAFEGPVHTIQMLSSHVCAAHRRAGAFTGKHHHIRQLDALFDGTLYQAKLAELRALPRPGADHGPAFQEAAE